MPCARQASRGLKNCYNYAVEKDAGIRVYSIGHGNRTVDEFAGLLQERGITALVDVRSSPFSKYVPDFNRHNLEAALKEREIEYVFMGGSLGGFTEDESYLTGGKADYSKLSERPVYIEGIGKLMELAGSRAVVCMMCSELKPEMCHRSKMIGETLAKMGAHAVHIDEEGKDIALDEVIRRITHGQASLFEVTYTSKRKF